jgi:hypothetical protein
MINLSSVDQRYYMFIEKSSIFFNFFEKIFNLLVFNSFKFLT